MKTVTFTEFRKNATAMFDAVEKGTTVRVMRHGKAVADLVPPSGKKKIPSWKLPATRIKIPGVSIAQTIIDERRKSR